MFVPSFQSGASGAVCVVTERAGGENGPILTVAETVGVLFCFCASGQGPARRTGVEAPWLSYKLQKPSWVWGVEIKPQDTPGAERRWEAVDPAGEGPGQGGTQGGEGPSQVGTRGGEGQGQVRYPAGEGPYRSGTWAEGPRQVEIQIGRDPGR